MLWAICPDHQRHHQHLHGFDTRYATERFHVISHVVCVPVQCVVPVLTCSAPLLVGSREPIETLKM